jgi:hypothetical protein
METTLEINRYTQAPDSIALANMAKGGDAAGFIRIQPNYIRSDIIMYLSPCFLAFKAANSDDSALYVHHIIDEDASGNENKDSVIESDSIIGRLRPKIRTILESITANKDLEDFERILPACVSNRICVYQNDRFTACKRTGSDTAPVYIRSL